MTRQTNISQHIFRMALCLAVMLCVVSNAAAQAKWDGKTATNPEGDGTADNPVIIASAENLYYVAKNPGSYNDLYLKQTVDIDLNGKEWIPIGNNDYPFKGKYDGMSHVIKGLSVDWGQYALTSDGKTRDANNYAYGLFGYLCGSVENLVIDGASIYQSDPKESTATDKDLRVGIFAGTVGCTNNSYIRNILIRNSSITSHPDNKTKSGKYFIAKAYMIGGLVGDIHAADSYTSTTEVKVSVKFQIKNICIDANIDVSNAILDPDRKFSDKGLQYYVGGLIGRARSVRIQHMPKYSLFSGKINAPQALVGPIFGGARANGKSATTTYEGAVNSYAGDFYAKTNGSAVETGTNPDFTYIFYSNYKIQNYSDESKTEGEEKVIEDKATSLIQNDQTGTNKGTYTLKKQPATDDATFSFDKDNLTPANMAMFQGVNRGTYANMSTDTKRAEVLDKINTDNNEVFRFVWRNNRVELQGNEDISALERTTIFKFLATMRNLKATTTYTYKWTVTDATGHWWTSSCQPTNGTISQTNETNDPNNEVVLKIQSANTTSSTCAIIGTLRPYMNIKLEVFDGTTLVDSEIHNIGDVSVSILRDIYKTNTDGVERKDHYLFIADIEIEGHHIYEEPDFFYGVECQWFVNDANASDKDADGFSLLSTSQYNATIAGNTFPQYEAHIKSTYVGNIRLKATCNNPDAQAPTPVTITQSVINGESKDYIEKENKGLHLSLTMEEYCGQDANGNFLTQPFDPAHYHVNPAKGKNGFYDEDESTASVYDHEGNITGINKDTKIKPLIFKVKVVDQFGNDWTNALSRYRIQWNYRISGEGAKETQKSTNYDNDYSPTDKHYGRVNGWFDSSKAADTEAPFGLVANKKGNETDYNNTGKTGTAKRSGHYELINDSILIIHPNILHRTSAFWVRAKLYDIIYDPAGEHPTEAEISYNQLGILLKKNENSYEGKVLWRLDPEEKTYVSATSSCDLIWYESPDPTDPNKWVKVDSVMHGTSRETTLTPSIYKPNCFYKLYYKSGSDLEVEEIIGPQNVVYVYDRAQTTANTELTSFNPYDQITNQYYPTGLLTNHGHDPYNAVRTMEQAYKLLDKNGKAEENVIVVMGYQGENVFLNKADTAKYNKNATITGKAPTGSLDGGVLKMAGSGGNTKALNGATIFENITLFGDRRSLAAKDITKSELYLYCNLHDLTIGKEVKVKDYRTMSANENGLGRYTASYITIIGGMDNYNAENIPDYPIDNAIPGMTTITIKSGSWGRIIGSARNNDVNSISRNIFAKPDKPHRVQIVVDIEHETDIEGKVTDKDRYTIGEHYPYDIGLLVGGQTDGSVFVDAKLIMKNGTVGRFISGNISYGRSVDDGTKLYPADGFYGSTELTVTGGEIAELVGGTLGRQTSGGGTATCDAYFYGRSILNLKGGIINNTIYGAGAGGVVGLGDDTNHTSDKRIPYYLTGTTLSYGDYAAAKGKMPTMTVYVTDDNGEVVFENGKPKEEMLNLDKSYCKVNISDKALIEGNVYGGGFGYSNMLDVSKALEQAGWLFGNTTINMTGGTVDGNIYGGGAGSDKYKTDKDTYNANPNNASNQITTDFTKVAQVYGNTSVNISGGTITGNIYGGGQGIPGFKDMAKVTGNTSVTISGDVSIVGKVVDKVASGGHVYGGASLGEICGNTHVQLDGGYIGGNVFGGSEGKPEFPTMATIYGKTCVTLGYKDDDGNYDGSVDVNASIYGGCNVSSIRKPVGESSNYGVHIKNNGRITKSDEPKDIDAMTKVIVNSGSIGNNIYGGSRGNDTDENSVTDIEGDTYVRINGGHYKKIYYITNAQNEPVTDSQGNKRNRDFNIFGGGEKKCIIKGTAHLDVRSGLMDIADMKGVPEDEEAERIAAIKADASDDMNIFIPHDENPNSLDEHNTSKFMGPYMDLTYRRFSLYGGGYGEKTNCLNTDVYVYIPTDKKIPHGRTLQVPYDHQSYFDIAGGGYSGDIGYWAKSVDGKLVPVDSLETKAPTDYEEYVGGACKVTIDGYTYARKVIGGGFYGSCKTTDTKILCGSLRQAYGGSLLGYVHDKALLEIGNRPEQMDTYDDPAFVSAGITSNDRKAKWLNDYIFFTENVYGGNDVKGIVGTQKWRWTDGTKKDGETVYYYGQEGTDGGPLWQADVDPAETKGVVMNIFGGTFMGDVFGAGNGHYRGYYVPGWIRYEDGPDRMYRMVRGINGQTFADDSIAHWSSEPDKVKSRHRVYRTRPMVGSVNINITGNGADDMVKILGNFYGGGRECSIGQWNTILPMEDPRRLSTGGHLHINLGGNIDFANNFYMGVYGGLYGNQQYLPDSVDIATFKGTTTEELAKIGEAAYDHWYFNDEEGHKRYEPGFPAKGKADGNFGLLGEHMFRGYFKNIEMEGDVELTFYKDLYEKKTDGTDSIANGQKVRKRWVPGEIAMTKYDANNITMNSFFLGGKCGYMTNNNVMIYCYTNNKATTVDYDKEDNHEHENFGVIYRIVMPEGVTIKDKLVMGVEDAVTKYYKYNETFTAADSIEVKGKKQLPEPTYTFEGGLVTQTTYSFDHVAYNDMMTAACEEHNKTVTDEKDKKYWNPTILLPDSFYLKDKYSEIWNNDSYELKAGVLKGTTIYRRTYDTYGLKNLMLKTDQDGNFTHYENNQHKRYGLAVVYSSGTHTHGNDAGAEPFFGRRASRSASGDDHQTVTKLTARCKFDPQPGNADVDDQHLSDDMKEYAKLYGGVIYGGCYNSGVVIGDVILNVASNMMGDHITDKNHKEWFDHISGLGHYIGRVYGGGYGVNTRNDGDTYINLLRNVKAMNVFGGGMQGEVVGDTYINYIGSDSSYVYGAIYGGGFQGPVGKYYWRNNDYRESGKTDTLLTQAEFNRLEVLDKENKYHIYVADDGTHVNLFSGNVDHVYGGSCMGNVYGRATVRLCDEVTDSLSHLDYKRLVQNESVDSWGESRLIVGTVYGGNDISGTIYHTPDSLRSDDVATPYDANVLLEETQSVDPPQASSPARVPASAPGKDTPGSHDGYNGFPLVGNLYGGSNGDYGTHDKAKNTYADNVTIRVATGQKNELDTLWLKNYSLPDIDRTNISIKGGTVVNVYGGGDMATVKDSTKIEIDYASLNPRAGFADKAELDRIREACHILSEHQLKEVMADSTMTIDGKEKVAKIFRYQVFRVFGGNNHADMNIQPTWNLKKGYVGSVYSGANFGKMTYYNSNADVTKDEGKGLTLIVNSPTFYANAVYGGGRVGDVEPMKANFSAFTDEEKEGLYGTTLIIRDGVVDHVYGGNDVSGEVVYGSDVRIYGAISGDVYCAGNGDYLYKYYPDSVFTISEEYIENIDNNGERYFALPKKIKSGSDYYTGSAEDKILAINSYRPNVQRSRLYIAGHENEKDGEKDTTIAYVHGSVYMGGNSATVSAKEGAAKDISFNIGSHVILNGIFMGSNGEQLTNPAMLENTKKLNGISIFTEPLLEKYMDAVAVDGLPKDFELSDTIKNAYIGDFFVGGNCGSMQSDTTITLSFPENITFYGKIVGGSNNAQLTYDGATYNGGLTKPLKPNVTDKVWLKVHSKFLPLTLRYPEHGNIFSARLENELLDSVGVFVRRKPDNTVCYVKADGTDSTAYNGSTYLTPGRCNIYGGCYNSGTVVGNVKIDLYSDMLLYGLDGKGVDRSKGDSVSLLSLNNRLRTVVNGIDDKQIRTFAVIGGGFGANTMMKGDIRVRLLPDTGEDCEYYESGKPGAGKTAAVIQHPSCATIFGGSQLGTVVGNTTIEMRDGTVLTNMYGASESNYMYGSTQTIIGYPKHYVCEVNGEFPLDRADTLSRMNDKQNHDGTDIVKRSVWYRKGDIVPNNVFERIKAKDPSQAATEGEDRNFSLCDDDSPMKFGVKWDSIYISVGDPASRQAHLASTDIATAIEKTPYYGHGNIYGGGFIPTGASGLIGEKTVKKFTADYMPAALAGVENNTKYGGNSSILIWDNPDNANPGYKFESNQYQSNTATIPDGAAIRDHVTIGTAKYVPVTLIDGQDKMGYYYLDGTNFKHQPSGKYSSTSDSGKLFYKIESDGGIYGNGRKVFCEGFRACDLAYYGYADYTPQMPKLINSFQRLDLLDITDCCLQLQGSQDFATNTVDATTYSMTRVAELRMNSSLTGNLEAGINDTINIGNTIHDTPRSRNMLAFFHHVKYLGALVSNVAFADSLRNKDGIVSTNSDSTYFNRKKDIVETYYNSNKDNDALTAFKKRNLGTAANMIGINNGYQLKLQGVYTATDSKGNVVDSIYYGPAIGVAEVKLLTLAIGEGGGYIYALNQHDPDTTKQTFQQTIGNFVFPGAHFAMGATQATDATLNYIIDDCFPEGQGYDYYKTASTVNVNDEQEIHYWYVNGQRYFFNATLSAWTSDKTSVSDSLEFRLDNSDNLIMLSGLTKDSKNIRIKSIKWTDQSGEGYTYDLTRKTGKNSTGEEISDLIRGYDLYLTIDSDTENKLTPETADKNGAWVASLSRETSSDSTYLASLGSGSYGRKKVDNDSIDNVPRLDIRLVDKVNNNAKDYYQDHLSKPATVQIVVAADNPNGTSTDSLAYEYTINLTITYLKGVSVHGNIVIENCALPGEMIYANAIDVTDETDESFASQMTRKWVLYKEGTNLPYNDIPTSCFTVPNDDSRIAIPAYYWMNGWKLAYVVQANGITARLHPAENAEHKALTVHNYHRMYPEGLRETGDTKTTPLIYDLQPVSGARVYINNEKDLEEFFKYMMSVQETTHDANSLLVAHRGHIGAMELAAAYDTIVEVNPQYAANIHFILQNDIPMTGSQSTNYAFAGLLSGNGHVIEMGDSYTQFMDENKMVKVGDTPKVWGRIYNLGFHSSHNSDVTVIGKNDGRMLNCFYYNDKAMGSLLPAMTGTDYGDNDAQYCYQNSATGLQKDKYGNSIYYDNDQFKYGRVAYNLNALYLNERYVRDTNGSGNSNPRNKSYVYNYYGDGEYRYADWSEDGGEATALRTAEHPNYRDKDNLGIILPGDRQTIKSGADAVVYGKKSTYHNVLHLVDDSRILDNDSVYQPNYPNDFIFFGQNLNEEERSHADIHPKALLSDYSNRVYRASGFYGSQNDEGFHFNRGVQVRQPSITAIDFTGKRTEERADAVKYKLGPDTLKADDGKIKQTVFFSPVLDLPMERMDTSTTDPEQMKLASFRVIGNTTIEKKDSITKNLLVYALEDNEANDKVTEIYGETTLENNIFYHRINKETDGTYSAKNGLFHLVDLQDFNAPIEFKVANRAWYVRQPSLFKEDNNAWEGICLPFTANRVSAKETSGYNNPKRDHGEISHFYGPELGKESTDGENISHEYWLRSLTGWSTVNDETVLDFSRPLYKNMDGVSSPYRIGPSVNDTIPLNKAEYHYANTYFDIYSSKEYQSNHKLPQYTTKGREFKDYPLLTDRVPYIISFPGERYYEFDMSGEFYYGKFAGEIRPYPQIVTYEHLVGNENITGENSAHPGVLTIPVSDDNSPYAVLGDDDGTYVLQGTYAYRQLASTDMKVMLPLDKQTKAGETPDGSYFQHIDNDVVEPFRVYLSAPSSSNALAYIGTRTISLDDEDSDEQEEKYTGVNLYVRGTDLVVTSDHDFILPLYGISGQLYRNLPVRAGMNVYHNLNTGVYVALGHKFVVRSR